MYLLGRSIRILVGLVSSYKQLLKIGMSQARDSVCSTIRVVTASLSVASSPAAGNDAKIPHQAGRVEHVVGGITRYTTRIAYF